MGYAGIAKKMVISWKHIHSSLDSGVPYVTIGFPMTIPWSDIDPTMSWGSEDYFPLLKCPIPTVYVTSKTYIIQDWQLLGKAVMV